MSHSSADNQNGGKFHFLGRERYYTVAGRQLDRKTNDGTDDYIGEHAKSLGTTLKAIIAIAIVAITLTGAVALALQSSTPLRLYGASHDIPIIYDNAGIIEDEEALQPVLSQYYDLTGICPVIYTVYDEEWKGRFRNVESYVYDTHPGELAGNCYMVLVCSVPKDKAGMAIQGELKSSDYTWTALRGRNTGAIISFSAFRKFSRVLNEDLGNGVEPGKAFGNAFSFATDEARSRMFPDDTTRLINFCLAFLPLVFTVAVFTVIIIVTIVRYKRERKITADKAVI